MATNYEYVQKIREIKILLFFYSAAVQCMDVGSIDNGMIEYSMDRTYGTVLTVECLTGYEIIGADKILCTSNGNWSDDLPVCQGIFVVLLKSYHTSVNYFNETYMSFVMRKSTFCICENKGPGQLTVKLISTFVFAMWIEQFLYFLNPKFPASILLLCLYSLSDLVGNHNVGFHVSLLIFAAIKLRNLVSINTSASTSIFLLGLKIWPLQE